MKNRIRDIILSKSAPQGGAPVPPPPQIFKTKVRTTMEITPPKGTKTGS